MSHHAAPRPHDWPIAVRLVDVRRPLTAIADVTGYPRTRIFITEGAELIGSTEIQNLWHPISETHLRHSIANTIAYAAMRRAVEQDLGVTSGPPPPGRSVSIVIPTCNRPDDLRRCLASVRAHARRPDVEVIVVDNRPGSGETRRVAMEFEGITVIDERRPGLSYARNAGFAAATGEILVAIDDDVTVTAGWIERLIAPFERPEVMAVTGHVLPVELETESQCRFEAYGGLGKGYNRFEVNGAWFRGMRGAVPTWLLGATANAAFRADIFRDPAIGLLDEALGAGMPTGCSEDTYLFYRILKAGHTIVYDPTAWVWHRHRSDMAALTQQIYAYSKGHVAYHLTTLLRDRDPRALVRLAWSLPRVYLRRMYARASRSSEYPARLILTEIAGNFAGPWALWQSRRRVRRFGPSAPYVPPGERTGCAGTVPPADAVSTQSPLTQGSAS